MQIMYFDKLPYIYYNIIIGMISIILSKGEASDEDFTSSAKNIP